MSTHLNTVLRSNFVAQDFSETVAWALEDRPKSNWTITSLKEVVQPIARFLWHPKHEQILILSATWKKARCGMVILH